MDEITKHALKIYKTARHPSVSLSKKIADIILEILIIVFAVSLAQFLERQREQSVKQKEVKEFLTGLKNDLKSDVEQAKSNVKFYNRSKIIYTYLSHLDPNKKPNSDTLNSKIDQININAFMLPSISRFEGFKSSGKLQDIENKQLLQNILKFYEQALTQLNLSESSWLSNQGRLSALFTDYQVIKRDGSNNNFEIICQPKAQNLCRKLVPWPQIYERYKQVEDLANTIVKEIDKNYPEA